MEELLRLLAEDAPGSELARAAAGPPEEAVTRKARTPPARAARTV